MPVEPYRLSAAGFAALATGDGDPQTRDLLRGAELSRRLLLLHAVARAGGPAAAGWFGQLTELDRRAPGPVRAVLAHPPVGAWAARCLARLRAGHDAAGADVGYLGAVTAAAALRAGGRLRVEVPVNGGTLALPTLGAAVLPGATTVVLDAAARTVEGGGHRVTVPAQPDRDAPGWCGLRRLAAPAGPVLLDDLDPYRAGPGLAPAGRLGDADVAHWQRQLAEAWALLSARHPGPAAAIAGDLRSVVPLRDDPAAGGISATAREAFGAVAMSAPGDPTALAVGLLHETRHGRLNAVQHLFDLVRPGRDRVYSPWRDDPRPPGGLLHGAYAYLGVTDFWRIERTVAGPPGEFSFARWRAAVAAATTALLRGPHLTGPGERFVAAMRWQVLAWAVEPVAPHLAQLAERANTDHRLRWRLRHLRVDPTGVGRLAAAWRAGRPVPPDPVLARVGSAAGRRLENNPRLTLVHALLRGSAEPAVGSAGDRAYARGDDAAAGAAYRSAVTARPDDEAAWAGLFLVTGDAAGVRPELVAAVYRAVRDSGGAAPEVAQLAGWLAGARYDDGGVAPG